MQIAEYFGVPMLAVPIALDQHENAYKLATNGYGINIDWKSTTSRSFTSYIVSMLQNKR